MLDFEPIYKYLITKFYINYDMYCMSTRNIKIIKKYKYLTILFLCQLLNELKHAHLNVKINFFFVLDK